MWGLLAKAYVCLYIKLCLGLYDIQASRHHLKIHTFKNKTSYDLKC